MYIIGKYYEVSCVKTTTAQVVGRGEWAPIIGPLHEDAVIIDFPLLHWHVDWRFASARQIQRLKVYSIDYLFAFPVQQRGIGPDQQLHANEKLVKELKDEESSDCL